MSPGVVVEEVGKPGRSMSRQGREANSRVSAPEDTSSPVEESHNVLIESGAIFGPIDPDFDYCNLLISCRKDGDTVLQFEVK